MKTIISKLQKIPKNKIFRNLNLQKNFCATGRSVPVLTEYYHNNDLIKLDEKKGYYNKIVESFLEKNFDGESDILEKISSTPSIKDVK